MEVYMCHEIWMQKLSVDYDYTNWFMRQRGHELIKKIQCLMHRLMPSWYRGGFYGEITGYSQRTMSFHPLGFDVL